MTAVIISPNAEVCARIEAALRGTSLFRSVWPVTEYPQLADLERLNQQEGCAVFLDFSRADAAGAIATHLNGYCHRVTTIAVNVGSTLDQVTVLMQAGIREVLPTFAIRPRAA